MVQNEDPAINLDAFENNYQEAVESSASKVVLSPIEQIFNGKDTAVSGKVLHQAGYDLFTSGSTPQTSAGKFGNSYKLSIGRKNQCLYLRRFG